MSKVFWVNVKALRDRIRGMSCASVRGVMYQLHRCDDNAISTKQQPANASGCVAIDEDAYNKFRLCDPLWALPVLAYAIHYLNPKFNVFCELPDEDDYSRVKPMTSEQLFGKIKYELGRAEQAEELWGAYHTLQSAAQQDYIDSGFDDEVFSASLERVGLADGDCVLSVDEYVERGMYGDIPDGCITKAKKCFDAVVENAVINFGSPEKKFVFLRDGDGTLHASGFLFPNCSRERRFLFATKLIDYDFDEVMRYVDEEPLVIDNFIDFELLEEGYAPVRKRDVYRDNMGEGQAYHDGEVIILCRAETQKKYSR